MISCAVILALLCAVSLVSAAGPMGAWTAPPTNSAVHPPPCQSFDFVVQVRGANDSGAEVPAAVYNISASYCPPTVAVASRAQTVQLLLHGATANKFYWSALGPVGGGFQEEHYSWIDVARAQGYHTIAIDRLGVGNSSHANPVDVRTGVEAQITSRIIQQLRSRGLPVSRLTGAPPHPKTFDRVVLIGHSFGSLIISYLMLDQPDAADAVILTGYVHDFTQKLTSVAAQHFAPASSIFPRRFHGLDPGYLTIVSAANLRQSFFGNNGSFDPIMPPTAFEREDVQATGEQASIFDLVSSSFATSVATNFTAPLAIIAGEQDEPLCNGNCGQGPENLAAQSAAFFPHASNFAPILIPNTGHLLNLHLSAPETFAKAHDWMAMVGF